MFVANSAWLLIRKRLTQIQLWSVVFQALPLHYSSEYKVDLHFLTQWRQSKHLLILGPKCLVHFSAELSETLGQFGTSAKMWVISAPNTVPKCLGSEVSLVRSVHTPYNTVNVSYGRRLTLSVKSIFHDSSRTVTDIFSCFPWIFTLINLRQLTACR